MKELIQHFASDSLRCEARNSCGSYFSSLCRVDSLHLQGVPRGQLTHIEGAHWPLCGRYHIAVALSTKVASYDKYSEDLVLRGGRPQPVAASAAPCSISNHSHALSLYSTVGGCSHFHGNLIRGSRSLKCWLAGHLLKESVPTSHSHSLIEAF